MDDVKSTDETLDELVASIDKIDETNWGPWKLDRSTRHIYVEQPTSYSLSIEELAANSLVLTLKHMEEKTWVTNEYLGGLARAAFAIWAAPGDPLNKK